MTFEWKRGILESDSKRDRGEKGVKERTKILNHMIAKTDRTDNDLASGYGCILMIRLALWNTFIITGFRQPAIKVICKDMGEEDGLKVCLFLAYCHDTAKMTYVFQSNISEGVKIIREAIIRKE